MKRAPDAGANGAAGAGGMSASGGAGGFNGAGGSGNSGNGNSNGAASSGNGRLTSRSSGRGSSGSNGGRTTSRRSRADREPGGKRWPWVLACLAGVLFIVAIGISSTKPAGSGLVITLSAMLARSVSAVAGIFSMFLCFMLMLNSIVKIARPGEPLPRFVWGLWVILLFAAAFYHAAKIPWDAIFQSAKTGGGGGLMGAGIAWFLRVAVTRPLSFVAMTLGLTVGVSLVLGKSPWAPFAFGWMLAISGWQWVRDFLADFFRERGPNPEDIEVAAEEGAEDGDGEEAGLEDLLTDAPRRKRASFEDSDREVAASSMSATVNQLKERLAKRDADSANQRAGSAGTGKGPSAWTSPGEPPVQSLEGWGLTAGPARPGAPGSPGAA